MVGVAAALLVSVAVTRIVIGLGPALGYIDRPDDPTLKAHASPAVPLGGVAIFIAVHTGLAIAGRFDVLLVVATAILLVLGLVDDRVGLSPALRLVVTAGAGLVLAWGSGLGTGILVVALVVITVNAVNLFDGLDGLAGSAGAVTAMAASGLAAVRGHDILPGFLVAAAVVGFLIYNWHPARVFLGDNGAYVLAALLVWLISESSEGAAEVAAALGVLGVFLVDLLVTVLRRRRAGAPLFVGDRSHVYDRLHRGGWSVPRVAMASTAAQIALAGTVLVLVWWLPVGWAVVAVDVVGLAAVATLTSGRVLPDPAATA